MTDSSKNSTKESVLACLEQNQGDFISGGALSAALGLSRNSVWKAIESLRSEGYKIEAVTRKGYRLSFDNDILSEEGIRARFQKLCSMNGGQADKSASGNKSVIPTVYVYPELESTNRTAKDLASEGALHGTLVIACRQTKGAGHKNSSFFSPEGGLYMSLILRPSHMPETKPSVLTSAASAAVVQAIYDQCGKKAELRALNRLYLDGKKVCGILSEGIWDLETDTPATYIVGIGIHYSTPSSAFPADAEDPAGSVFPEVSSRPSSATRNDLAARICYYLLSSLT